MDQRSNCRRRGRRHRSFTLIELLIVIAILLGLVGIVAVSLLNVQERSDVDLQRVQLEMIEKGIQHFRLDMKRVPSEDEGLAALWDKTVLETEEDESLWRGPYLDEPITADKWGRDLIYRQPAELVEGAPYDLVSIGPDGEEDTEDDITNHSKGAGGGDELDFGINE